MSFLWRRGRNKVRAIASEEGLSEKSDDQHEMQLPADVFFVWFMHISPLASISGIFRFFCLILVVTFQLGVVSTMFDANRVLVTTRRYAQWIQDNDCSNCSAANFETVATEHVKGVAKSHRCWLGVVLGEKSGGIGNYNCMRRYEMVATFLLCWGVVGQEVQADVK
jgi:hypothetical protein